MPIFSAVIDTAQRFRFEYSDEDRKVRRRHKHCKGLEAFVRCDMAVTMERCRMIDRLSRSFRIARQRSNAARRTEFGGRKVFDGGLDGGYVDVARY